MKNIDELKSQLSNANEKKDYVNMKILLEKILEIDPNDEYANSILHQLATSRPL